MAEMMVNPPNKPLKLAMIGMRGLPADLPKAGGGERETEAKSIRLSERGHQVTVYCRWHYNRHPVSPYHGIRLVSLPSIPTKNLDTISHTFLATLHALANNRVDVICYHGMGNALFLPLVRLGRKKSVVYMDGLDWERPKWGRLARMALKIAAQWAFRLSDAVYVDNQASQKVFKSLFGYEPEVITLAADLWDHPGANQLPQYGLQPEKYILFVGLLKPDKGVHHLIQAYRDVETAMPLVIVGDSTDEPEYKKYLYDMADKRVRFLGFVYGQAARQLFANACIYVQPSIMEGNSPSLMSAMACGRCTVVSGIEQNLETIGDTGIAFKPGDASHLHLILSDLIHNPEKIASLGRQARSRIEQVYNWDVVVDQLERLYKRVSSA